MTDTFATLIVQAQDAPTSRDIAAAFGPGGANMFTTPLSASGLDPATHYISTGYIPAEFVALSPMVTWEQDDEGGWWETDYYAGDAATVALYANQEGVEVTEAQVASIFSRSDVSSQEPFTAMGRLGLQIINPPQEEP